MSDTSAHPHEEGAPEADPHEADQHETYAHSTDAHDLALAIAGEGEAFGRIFDRHRDRIRRHSLRLVPAVHDVDDVVAITFLEAWRRRDLVRIVDGSMLPWLLVTATNVAQNLRRGARRHRALLLKLPPADHAADHADLDDDGPASEALRSLSLADRQVLTLCVLEGLPIGEAADALGIPAGTVKSRLSRARQRLAQRVAPLHPTPPHPSQPHPTQPHPTKPVINTPEEAR
jgi:RNA polymerase sigma-70 factor (ECF subfamily)